MAGRGPERIDINSEPTGADVTVNCGGDALSHGVTPTSVLVKRTSGDCGVSISKEGYVTRTLILEQGFNARYWGNIPMMIGIPVAVFYTSEGDRSTWPIIGLGIMGGAGMIIDTVNDARHDHDPKSVMITLQPVQASAAAASPPR